MNTIEYRAGILNLSAESTELDEVSGGFGFMEVAPYIVGVIQTAAVGYFTYYATQSAWNREQHRNYCRELVENVVESSFENIILAWRFAASSPEIPAWIRTMWQNAQNNVNNGATTPSGVCDNV